MDDVARIFAFLMVIVATLGIGYLVVGGVGLALRRMERRPALPRELDHGSPDVEARLAALERATERLAELEERVDFAERLLARHRDAASLPRE